jgi:hypothetical protein
MPDRNHGRSAWNQLALGGGTSGERIAAGGAIVGSGFRRDQRNRLFWASQFRVLCHTWVVGQPRLPPPEAKLRLSADSLSRPEPGPTARPAPAAGVQ